jgi:hypothetical protein
MLLGRRSHRRITWLALFALWLQLGLSFGHTHPEDFFGLGGQHQTQLIAAAHTAPGLPGGPISDSLGHEACAICASISLAGTLVVAVPPVIAPPRFDRRAPPPLFDYVVVYRAPHLLFQTRAPPVA